MSKIYIQTKREVTDETLRSVICDNCKKEIEIKHSSYRTGGVYYEVTTHHNDWGNDSRESFEYFDFCSYECLAKHQEQYFKNARGSEQYEIERIRI